MNPLIDSPTAGDGAGWGCVVTGPIDAGWGSAGTLDAWSALADRIDADPFRRPEWLVPWWSAFGRGHLRLVTVEDDGRTTAALAMCRRPGRVDSLTNWHTPLSGPISESPSATQRLARALVAGTPCRVVLDLVDTSGTDVEDLVTGLEGCGYWVEVRERLRSPVIEIDGKWEGYAATLPHGLRRRLRRASRRLDGMGRVVLDVRDGTSGLDGLLTEGFAVEASGWKGERGTAVNSSPVTQRFYRDFARAAASRGWLRLGFLRVDGRAVAFDYAVEHGGVHYTLKTGYDERAGAGSPGLLLRQAMLRRAFDLRLCRYEFLGSDLAWKLEWTSDVRRRVRIRALAPGPKTAFERWARTSDGPTMRSIRRMAAMCQ